MKEAMDWFVFLTKLDVLGVAFSILASLLILVAHVEEELVSIESIYKING